MKTAEPGRYCALHRQTEETALRVGTDFRESRYRREVFLRFWEFHLRYRSHPGGVYYVLPYLADRLGWSTEQRLWFAFINGNTQHPPTSWLIFREFPLVGVDFDRMKRWFAENYTRLEFDTDRRYFKTKFLTCVQNYVTLLGGRSQEEFFNRLTPADERTNFRQLWQAINTFFVYFGRLSSFSYAEYLRINGVRIDCDQLFLDDMQGSKSHRNGLCKVLGRDDLDWHDDNTSFDGTYSPAVLRWLEKEAAELLEEMKVRAAGESFYRDVGYFTMESTLCTYKGWHRVNRRYPNVYNDMLYLRLKKTEEAWGERLHLFWDARKECLPEHLRLEDNPKDPGLCPRKMNHYRLTGQVIMMDKEWGCFANDFNDEVRRAQK